MNPTRAYDDALDVLYKVFSDYPFRRNMPCCIPHCMDQADLDVMGSIALREISAEQIKPFASNLNTTCGEREDFKFVLPRLFELSSDDKLDWPERDLVCSWLRTEDLPSWPVSEQHAVIGFLDAWWARELSENPDAVTETFEALGCTGIDVRRWMNCWSEARPVSLADWIANNMTSIWSGTYGNAFADDRPLIGHIKEFLEDPKTAAALERAFHATNNIEEQDILSLAEHCLRR
jgi:hypothetical protein